MQRCFKMLFFLYLITSLLNSYSYNLPVSISKTPSFRVKTIFFYSNSQNMQLNTAICNQLRLNNIKVIMKNPLKHNIPFLHIISSNLYQEIPFMFNTAYPLIYEIVLCVNAEIKFLSNYTYPISIKKHRLLFKNPQGELAQDVEQQIIINDMFNALAEELVKKLLIMKNVF